MDAMVYGLCLERLKHQIELADRRHSLPDSRGLVQLESFLVSEIDDIIDMLDLHDLEDRSPEGLRQKLDDLAETASVLIQDAVRFEYNEEGVLGLYRVVESLEPVAAGERL